MYWIFCFYAKPIAKDGVSFYKSLFTHIFLRFPFSGMAQLQNCGEIQWLWVTTSLSTSHISGWPWNNTHHLFCEIKQSWDGTINDVVHYHSSWFKITPFACDSLPRCSLVWFLCLVIVRLWLGLGNKDCSHPCLSIQIMFCSRASCH